MKKSTRHSCILVGGAILTAATPWSLAAAQTSSDGPSYIPEEIIVTARKREESLQEFAGALTAISSDQFGAAQLVNMQDIRDLVPNLYLEEDLGGATTTKIFVRGIGIDNPDVSFDSPVGIYIDGVYHARAFGSLSDLHDVERIEFLRGPQGTLYGRNNSAGALRVVTKRPSLEETEAGASLGFGTEGQIDASAYWSVPVQQGKSGFRASLSTRQNDGFMTETTTGRKFKNDDLISGRASFLTLPNDQWELVLRGDFLINEGVGSLASSIVPGFNADDDIYTATLNLTPENSLDVFGTSITASRQGERFNLTSITAYRDIKMRNTGGDADGTPLSLLEGALQNLDEYQFSEEIFISSAGKSTVDWTAGLFFLREENEIEQSFNVFPAIFGPATTQFSTLETDSFALYAEADFAASERVTLTVGLRYSDESKEVDFDSFNNDGTFGFAFADKVTEDRVTYKAVVDFAATDDVFLYASASTGFRSGGIGLNPAARSTANVVNDIFEPETAMSYEAGVKSSFLDGRVQFNATYFYVEYEELQLAVAGAGGITVNTPDANVHGFEGELTANISEQFSLNATIGTQSDDIKESDLELKNTPDWQARLGATYSADLPGGSLSFSADLSYTDDYFASTANSITVDSHPLANAVLRWTSESERWAVSVSGKNLTDEYYPIHGFRIIPGLLDNEFPNHPRRWLATVYFTY